jgi:hypothetical protein
MLTGMGLAAALAGPVGIVPLLNLAGVMILVAAGFAMVGLLNAAPAAEPAGTRA